MSSRLTHRVRVLPNGMLLPPATATTPELPNNISHVELKARLRGKSPKCPGTVPPPAKEAA